MRTPTELEAEIRHRQRAEESLRLSEERFRMLVESTTLQRSPRAKPRHGRHLHALARNFQ
jgi:hypothetical protein